MDSGESNRTKSNALTHWPDANGVCSLEYTIGRNPMDYLDEPLTARISKEVFGL
jgi:hypothetical protein